VRAGRLQSQGERDQRHLVPEPGRAAPGEPRGSDRIVLSDPRAIRALAEELAKAVQAMRDTLAPYEQRRRDARPVGSRRVRIARMSVPRADNSGSAPGVDGA
jgi:hypothetical protein